MQKWLVGEPSLDELLGDEMMGPVVASAGMSREQFRSSLMEIAVRLGVREGGAGQHRDAPRRIAVGR